MPEIEVDDASGYQPQHQELTAYEATIKADLYHWRQEENPVGKTPIEIQTCFEPGQEPFILIGEEGCECFEPTSAAAMLTFPKIIQAMFNWSAEACDVSEADTAMAMADYLEMLAKVYRRQGEAPLKEQPARTRDTDHMEEA